jgi:hypothetical protein
MADNPRVRPADTASTLKTLTTIGERMATDWKTISTEIANLAGQLGKGELGAAFLASYQQPATDTARAVDQCCQRPHEYATTGTQSVTQLTGVDGINGRSIRAGSATPETAF